MNRILIVTLLALACCTGRKEAANEATNSPEDDFTKFVALLPKVNLPYETTCDKCCKHPQIDDNYELIKNLYRMAEHW
jgi:hypothetical protein